ncbi:MAG: NAD-dependent epimerase/dehydratase family protein [Candidatus Electryonea clarkiae]|nr:NAD-dependent epimerase/dehydratase family protein [Candidatus Electryonea clarkiae]MDP8288549.1 NAD-dependent epimerase/dehydratase family protein [Candidatus Electryonea clarkiae]
MSSKVLLTGGRGFFGRRILEALQKHEYDVTTPSRPEFDLMDFKSAQLTIHENNPEIVIHSAAYYGGLGINVHEPANLFFKNTIMVANLLEACGNANVKRFISIGSACAYPQDVDGDMKEDDFWSGPLHSSVEAYGFSKKIQQVGARAYHKQYGIKGQFPQITNLYGENDVFTEYRSHVAAALIKRFADAKENDAEEVVNWGTGKPVREFLYAGDAAEAIIRLMETDYFDTMNIGTGIGTTIKELAELIAKHIGYEGKIVWDTSKPDGVMRKVLDISRMKEVLQWEPPTSLDEGLGKTINWYLSNKEKADLRE